MLRDDSQYRGFALLTATGGPKPFECVGEAEESVAAIRMLADDPRWSDHSVVRRLAGEVLPRFAATEADPSALLVFERPACRCRRRSCRSVHALLGA